MILRRLPPNDIAAIHGVKRVCHRIASRDKRAEPRILRAPIERRHHRSIGPWSHGYGSGNTGLGCCNDLEHMDVDLRQESDVFPSIQLATPRTSDPGFLWALARMT